jgi:hypothetical protein
VLKGSNRKTLLVTKLEATLSLDQANVLKHVKDTNLFIMKMVIGTYVAKLAKNLTFPIGSGKENLCEKGDQHHIFKVSISS